MYLPRKEVLFRNLPACAEGGFESADGIGAGWMAFEYELDDFTGVGVATGANSAVSELVLDLNLKGWHILHFCHTPTLRIWLDGESGYREMDVSQPEEGIRDYPLHAADLTGRRLHIMPRRGTGSREAILFYIRAEPVDAPRKSRRNLVAANDGHDVFWHGLDSMRDLSRHLIPYRDSDFFRILWGVFGGGDFTTDPGCRTATVLPWDTKHEFYANERIFNDSIARLAREGDILSTVVKLAHAENLEIHLYFRVGMFYAPFPGLGHSSRFFLEHPEFRCRDEFGNEVKRLSYAFPEVQDHLLAYFKDLMRHGADGLCLTFTRGLPLMACEGPVIQEFQRQYGRAPRLPEEVDSEAMLSVRHDLLAGFVARVRDLTAHHGQVLSCTVPRNFDENRRRGLDLELLLRRGLFESVMVGAGHEDNPRFTQQNRLPDIDQDDLEPVKRLKAIGTARVYLGGCSNHGTFWPPNNPGLRARRMRAILQANLDGGYFWDTDQWFSRDWEHIRQYGDSMFLDRLLNGAVPPPCLHDTRRIHDLSVDRYNPWNAQ